MKIKLIAVGERVPKWVTLGYAEYAQRLSNEISLELIEVKAQKRSKNSDLNSLRSKEGEKILALLGKHDHVVALDEQGQLWDTLCFSIQLQHWREANKTVCLLIGGADGLAPACKQRAAQLWALSALTLPHALVRIIAAEQVYRAWTILAHHPYHRL